MRIASISRPAWIVLTFALCIAAARPAAAQVPVYLWQWGYMNGTWSFNIPKSVAVGPDGFVYVVDYGAHVVQKFTREGAFLLQFGGEGSGPGQLWFPEGVAVSPTGEVFVGDPRNVRIQVFSSSGAFLRSILGLRPKDLEFAGSSGLYVVQDYQVLKLNPSGAILSQWGSYGSGSSQFQFIGGIAVDPGHYVYVSDRSLNQVKKFSADGVFLGAWGSFGGHDGYFQSVSGLCLDAAGRLLAVDSGNNRVQIFSSDGVFLGKFGGRGSTNGLFRGPMDIAPDALGNFYVTEYTNQRVQVFGDPPVAASRTSWGRIKALYR